MNGDNVVSRNALEFRAHFERVCASCGRNSAEITVVAVSKTKPLEMIRAAVAAGFVVFGESKVQEVQAKLAGVERDFELHMIGHLQSNKAKLAVQLFDMIQSVDSLKLAVEIDKEAARVDKVMPILLEVNTSREDQKYGLAPEQVGEAVTQVLAMRNLRLCGLMTIAPFVEAVAPVRAAFVELRNLFETIKSAHPEASDFRHLSMGMSDDWEIAVAEGATMIRIGRALFGERN